MQLVGSPLSVFGKRSTAVAVAHSSFRSRAPATGHVTSDSTTRGNGTLTNINDDPGPVPNVFHRISR
jgi:hypothetical protein